MRGNLVGSLTGRLGLLAVSALAAASLAACGGEAAMNSAYDKNFHDSCVTAAAQGGSNAIAETYCSCVVTQLDKIPISQRVSLKPDSDQVNQAVNTCKTQAGIGATPDMTSNATAPAPMSGDTSGGAAPGGASSGGSTNAAP
jgi:hypothetical protein